METYEIKVPEDMALEVDHPFAKVRVKSCSGFMGNYLLCDCDSLKGQQGGDLIRKIYEHDGFVAAPRVVLRGNVADSDRIKESIRQRVGCYGCENHADYTTYKTGTPITD